jgi:hypothetical protein
MLEALSVAFCVTGPDEHLELWKRNLATLRATAPDPGR